MRYQPRTTGYALYRRLGLRAHQFGSEPSFIGRSIPVPRGKVPGGSTAINDAVAMGPPKIDHDRWAREHGLEGWSWDGTLPAFRRLERTSAGADALHGRSGRPRFTSLALKTSDMQRAFVETAVSAGYLRAPISSSRKLFGASPIGSAMSFLRTTPAG